MTFKVKDGISVAGTLFVDSATNVTIVSTTTSVSSTTGALVVAGGIGVKGNIYAGSIYTNGQLIGASSNTATNIGGGTVGSIPIQSALGQTGFIPISSTAGYILMAVGLTATWVSTSSLGISASGGSSNNIQGGTTGALLYQSAPNVTSFIGIGPAGTLLQSNGTTATWVSSSSFGAFSGGTVANNTIFQNTVTLTSSTISVSTTTGALIVQGGIGVGGNVNIAGTVTGGGIRTSSTSTAPLNPTVGDIWYVTGSDIVARYTSDGTSTYWLDMSGPSFAGIGPTVNVTNPDFNTSTLVTRSVNAFNISGGAPGAIPYQTQFGQTTFLGIGASAFVLTSNGTQPVWQALSGVASGSATTASNLANGTAGQIPYQANTGSTVFTGPGNVGEVLVSQGGGLAPIFTSTNYLNINFASTVSNLAGGTVGSIPIQSALGRTGFIPLSSTSGYVLQVIGTTATWVSTSSLGIGVAYNTNTLVAQAITATFALYANTSTTSSYATSATTILGGVTGQILYQSAPNATSFAGPGTSGQLLVSQGSNAPAYVSTAAIHVGASQYSQTANQLSGGSSGQIPYQANSGQTSFFGPGTSGQLLISGGATGPSFANTASIHIASAQYAVTATNLSNTGSIQVSVAQFAVTATNLAGGVAGGIGYQQAPGTTSFIGIGTTGSLLISNGTTSTFSDTASRLTLTNTTNSSDTGTGALIVNGGAGIGNSLYVGGDSKLFSTTPSVNSGTGALQVVGGVGIGGDTYIGGNIVASGLVIGGGVRAITSTTPPDNPSAGDIWYDPVLDITSRFTYDGIGNYWVDISSPSVAGVGPSTSTTINILGSSSGGSFATPTAIGSVFGHTTSTRKNTALGYCTGLNSSITGCNNLALGYSALACASNSIGDNNIALGQGAGAGMAENVCGNIAIGQCTMPFSAGYSNIGIGRFIAIGGTGVGSSDNISIGYGNIQRYQGNSNISIGTCISSTGAMCGGCNILIGGCNIIAGTGGYYNIAIGAGALKGPANQSPYSFYSMNNIAIGILSLADNDTGYNNVAIGVCSLRYNSSGYNNTAIGSNTLRCNFGNKNTALGNSALFLNTVGNCNTSLGNNSLSCNISGNNNVAVGDSALTNNNIGSSNVAVGLSSLSSNTYGTSNTAIGSCALCRNLTGCYNVAIGYMTGYQICAGDGNVVIGDSSGFDTSVCNILIGGGYYSSNTTGCNNVILGNGNHWGSGYNNVLVGNCNLQGTSGSQSNIAVGNNNLSNNATGCSNIAIGQSSMYSNVAGYENIGIGKFALANNTYGYGNTVIGSLQPLYSNTIGCNNTAIGKFAGGTNSIGSNNTFIGYNSSGPTATTNNTITLGNSSIACIRGQVAMTTFSDCRDKTNICSMPVGLDFVRALRPVKFEWNMRDNPNDGKKGMTEPGFLAQELDQVVEKFDANWMNLVHKDNPDRWEATLSRLLPVAIKAIQELSIEVDRLRNIVEPSISK